MRDNEKVLGSVSDMGGRVVVPPVQQALFQLSLGPRAVNAQLSPVCLLLVTTFGQRSNRADEQRRRKD
jgi:hypothetical protein